MKKTAGWTLTETLIVISLLAILFSLGTVLFANFAREDEVEATAQKIVAVINEAQAKTLAGFTLGGGGALNFGVHFEVNSYTLFSGLSFDPSDVNNQKYLFSERLEINPIMLSDGNLIFEKITGEVRSYDPANNYLVVVDQASKQQRRIEINKLGTVTIE